MSEARNNREIVLHPVQCPMGPKRDQSKINSAVTLRAYEVYRKMFGEQKALIKGGCRGGFGAGELMAFLYARSFPPDQWSKKFDEAMEGMNNL